jgi:hypothetical protein
MRLALALAATALAMIGATSGGAPARADDRVPYILEVQNASAKVGEQTMVVATVKPPQGFNITKSYRSRVIDLSVLDNKGVEFADEVVLGRLENGSAVFEVPVTPTEPGEHPINGIIRISFHTHGKSESKSVPLMATVTGE